MLLSSGVIWRHRTFDEFRAECPGGDPSLQARIIDELDDALDWLERLGVEPVRQETGNPLTVGRRYDTAALTRALVQAAWNFRRLRPLDPISHWAMEIERRRGKFIATVAVARKLAAVLFALWRDGSTYAPNRTPPTATAT